MSRFQAEGLQGPSEVTDPRSYHPGPNSNYLPQFSSFYLRKYTTDGGRNEAYYT
jgi:hypothetical protein